MSGHLILLKSILSSIESLFKCFFWGGVRKLEKFLELDRIRFSSKRRTEVWGLGELGNLTWLC